MQDEIELKIMLIPEHIPLIIEWISQQNIIHQAEECLINTYYDTTNFYFEKQQMGLRVRTKNNKHQLTLKTKGNIIGGLHIRPEYNLDLPDNQPDFKRLVSHYNLLFNDDTIIDSPLFATFSTDFTRRKYLIAFQSSQIEIAVDQGMIKNQYGEEAICEIEFELKEGNISDLFALLNIMPKRNKMWLSSLSKAQRGYLVGNNQKMANEINKLTACYNNALTEIEKYQLTQQLADFIRLTQDKQLIKLYQQITQTQLENSDLLFSQSYLVDNIDIMNHFYNS